MLGRIERQGDGNSLVAEISARAWESAPQEIHWAVQHVWVGGGPP